TRCGRTHWCSGPIWGSRDAVVMRRLLLVVALLGAAACSSGGGPATNGEVLIVVSAPITAQPWVGRFAERGAQLAAQELNANGGAAGRKVVIDVLDNGG